jgi:hypothetical protein
MPFQACCLAPLGAPRLRSDTGEAAREALAAAGFADRSDVVAGSFFRSTSTGRRRYLLSAILHNWDDDAARAILRHCAEAADRDGAVFVVEKIGADGETVYTERDLRVLAHFGGRDGARDRRRRCLRGHQSPLCVAHVDTTDVTERRRRLEFSASKRPLSLPFPKLSRSSAPGGGSMHPTRRTACGLM